MTFETLTFKSVDVRPVLVPLKRPVVSRVGLFDQWPMILIDLHTEEGIVGRSYLEPYLKQSVRSIVPAIQDLAGARAGQPVRPLDDFQNGRKSLNLVGYEGVSMIAVAGLDMAEWDALAKAAGLPLAVFLGGSLGAVPAYNSNGLWLTDVATLGREAAALVAEGEFTALKLRLGRDRLHDDLDAIAAVRGAVGPDVKLMVDFNQGLTLGDALHRCHALDDQGLYWFEEPIAYDNLAGYAQLARELDTPVQLGENFYGPRDLFQALAMRAGDYVMPDLMRIGGVSGWLRAVADRGGRRRRGLHPSVPRGRRPPHAGHRDGALAGMAGLGRPHRRRAVRAPERPRHRSQPPRQRPGVERGRRQAISLRHLNRRGGRGCRLLHRATGHSRRHTPNELRTAIRKAAPIRHLRRISDQFSAIARSVGSMGPSSMVSAVKMAWTSTGNTRSAITILATIAPCTGSSCRSSYGPDGRSGRALTPTSTLHTRSDRRGPADRPTRAPGCRSNS